MINTVVRALHTTDSSLLLRKLRGYADVTVTSQAHAPWLNAGGAAFTEAAFASGLCDVLSLDGIDEEVAAEIHQLFGVFDGGSGLPVEMRQLASGLAVFGPGASAALCRTIFDMYCPRGAVDMTKDSFTRYAETALRMIAAHHPDAAPPGSARAPDAVAMSRAVAKHLFETVDTSGDGLLSYDEFASWFMTNLGGGGGGGGGDDDDAPAAADGGDYPEEETDAAPQRAGLDNGDTQSDIDEFTAAVSKVYQDGLGVNGNEAGTTASEAAFAEATPRTTPKAAAAAAGPLPPPPPSQPPSSFFVPVATVATKSSMDDEIAATTVSGSAQALAANDARVELTKEEEGQASAPLVKEADTAASEAASAEATRTPRKKNAPKPPPTTPKAAAAAMAATEAAVERARWATAEAAAERRQAEEAAARQQRAAAEKQRADDEAAAVAKAAQEARGVEEANARRAAAAAAAATKSAQEARVLELIEVQRAAASRAAQNAAVAARADMVALITQQRAEAAADSAKQSAPHVHVSRHGSVSITASGALNPVAVAAVPPRVPAAQRPHPSPVRYPSLVVADVDAQRNPAPVAGSGGAMPLPLRVEVHLPVAPLPPPQLGVATLMSDEVDAAVREAQAEVCAAAEATLKRYMTPSVKTSDGHDDESWRGFFRSQLSPRVQAAAHTLEAVRSASIAPGAKLLAAASPPLARTGYREPYSHLRAASVATPVALSEATPVFSPRFQIPGMLIGADGMSLFGLPSLESQPELTHIASPPRRTEQSELARLMAEQQIVATHTLTSPHSVGRTAMLQIHLDAAIARSATSMQAPRLSPARRVRGLFSAGSDVLQ